MFRNREIPPPTILNNTMASRRLLDLYAIANASVTIAREHLLIRSHQITHYAATTSIGIGRTTSQRPQPVPVRHEAPSPTPSPEGKQPEGVSQDHHYSPVSNLPAPPTPRSNLNIAQSPPSPHRHAPPSLEAAKRLQAVYESRIPSETADPPMMPETHADVLGQEDIRAEDLTRGLNEDSFYLCHGKMSQAPSNLPRAKIPRVTEADQPKGVTKGINSSGFMRGLPADGKVEVGGKVPSEAEGERIPREAEADQPRTVAKEINSSEFMRDLPQEEEGEKVLEELGNQAFTSRRARGLFGVRPSLKMLPKKTAAQPSAEDVAKPVELTPKEEEEDIVRAVAEDVERDQVVVDRQEVEGIAAEVRREMNVKVRYAPRNAANSYADRRTRLTQSSPLSSSRQEKTRTR